MRAGFHSVGLAGRSLLDAIDRVADAGYATIELNAETLPWAQPHVTPVTAAAERAAIRDVTKRRGIGISAVGAHIPMVEEDAAARRAAVDFVKGCTDLAAEVGAPVIHILSGEAPKGIPQSLAWQWFADAVAETAAYAGERRVRLGIEAIAGHLFHAIDDFRRLAADLPGTPVFVNFDPSHLIVQGEDPARMIAERGNEIVHVHAKDGTGRYPDFAFPPLGQGGIDFAGLLGALAKVGYDGVISVEYEAQVFGFKETEEEILAHGRRFLRALGV
jgi:sugar phosphate isomerase/epimerase